MSNALRSKVFGILADYAMECLDETADDIVALATGDEKDEQAICDGVKHAIGDPDLSVLLPELTSIVLNFTKHRKSARNLAALRTKVLSALADYVMECLDETVDSVVVLATGDEKDEGAIRDAIGYAIEYAMGDQDLSTLLPKLTPVVLDSIKARNQVVVCR